MLTEKKETTAQAGTKPRSREFQLDYNDLLKRHSKEELAELLVVERYERHEDFFKTCELRKKSITLESQLKRTAPFAPLSQALQFKDSADWCRTLDEVIKSLILDRSDDAVFCQADKNNIHALYLLKEVFGQALHMPTKQAQPQPETQLQTA